MASGDGINLPGSSNDQSVLGLFPGQVDFGPASDNWCKGNWVGG